MQQIQKKPIGGWIIIAFGVLCALVILAEHLEIWDLENKLGDYLLAIGSIAYGIFLLFVPVKKYGWGFGSIFGLGLLCNSIIESDILRIVIGAIAFIACTVVFVLVQKKNN